MTTMMTIINAIAQSGMASRELAVELASLPPAASSLDSVGSEAVVVVTTPSERSFDTKAMLLMMKAIDCAFAADWILFASDRVLVATMTLMLPGANVMLITFVRRTPM